MQISLVSGIPGDVWYHGLLFPATLLVGATFGLVTVGNLFLPIFHKMKLVSVYEVRSHPPP